MLDLSGNVSFSEGVDKQTGIETIIHMEDNVMVAEKRWDAAPHLKHAEQARIDTAGNNWGEGKFIGHIPPAFYAQICVIKDKAQRQLAIKTFFKENPAFIMFDKYKP